MRVQRLANVGLATILLAWLAGAGHARAETALTRDGGPASLRIDVQDIKPLVVTPTSTLRVAGTITNPGPAPVFAITLDLVDDGMAGTRAALDAEETAPGGAGPVLVSRSLSKELLPGHTTDFTLTVPAIGTALGVNDGDYDLAVVASGALAHGGASTRLGLASVPIPYFPDPIRGKLRTALVIPVTAEPDQGPVPLLPGDPVVSGSLVADLMPEGRLDRLLTAIEAAPAAGGFAGTQLTLAIDPALLDRVCTLAGRCGKNRVTGTPAVDTQLADAWLSRLSAAVDSPLVTVVGLPYADADLAAIAGAGDTDEVVSLLTRAGGEVDQDLTLAAPTDLQPLLPVDGLADAGLTAAAIQAGSTVAVVSSALFQNMTPPAGQPVTPTASTTIYTSAGSLPALVMDGGLQRMLNPAADSPESPRMQEQLLLAELGVITSEEPNDPTQRTVVLEAPRDWDVSTDFSTGLVNALGAVPYVESDSLLTIAGAPGAERIPAAAAPKPASSPLPASAVAAVDSERPLVAALRAVSVDGHDALSPPFDEGLDRSLSAWWRGQAAGDGATLLASVTNELKTTAAKVSVGGGRNGVLLTGPSGILPVQVRNELTEPIAIVVHVETAGVDQVTGRDVKIRLDPGSAQHQVNVQITTRSTRAVSVTIQLLAQSDTTQEIASATIEVRSTSVGKVAVGITATALTLLVLLIIFRAARQLAARRRARASAL